MFKNRNFLYTVGAGLLVVVLLVTIGIMRRHSTNSAVLRALADLVATDSVHVNGELQLHLPPYWHGRERPFREVVTRIDGDLVKSATGQRELTGKLYGEAKGRGNIFFTDGELRVLSDAVAFRLNNLPVLLNPSGSLINHWTYVETPVLETKNSVDVHAALTEALSGVKYVGRERVDDQALLHFSGTITPEQEDRLVAVLQSDASGSRAWHQLARLLQANNVGRFEVWLDARHKTLARISTDFARPLAGGSTYDFATLDLHFSDSNPSASVERPDRQYVVQPGVFARLFGTGEIATLDRE